MKALIDCDVLVYKSSFGAQKTRYNVLYKNKTYTFENAKDRDAWFKENKLTKEDVKQDVWTDVLDEPIALHIAKKNLQEILDDLKVTDFQLYLTGEGNYREEIAVTKPYKGNRQQEKPVHFNAVKQYYLDQGAIVCTGMEADDMLGIQATINPKENIICTIDKDLNQVPGLHYDWNIGKKFRVRKADADRFFIMQLLTGDTTDNIQGMKGMGWKGAEKMYKEACELTSALHTPGENNVVFFEQALAKYEEKGYNKEYVEEQGQLLWIQRKQGEPLWTIDGFRQHLGE